MQTTPTTHEFKKDIDKALKDIEQIAEEVRVKLHLAGMDAKDAWTNKLEPRLFEARMHAKQATQASKAAVEATLKAFRDFAQGL